jgi:hypothetical protein
LWLRQLVAPPEGCRIIIQNDGLDGRVKTTRLYRPLWSNRDKRHV